MKVVEQLLVTDCCLWSLVGTCQLAVACCVCSSTLRSGASCCAVCVCALLRIHARTANQLLFASTRRMLDTPPSSCFNCLPAWCLLWHTYSATPSRPHAPFRNSTSYSSLNSSRVHLRLLPDAGLNQLLQNDFCILCGAA